MNIGQTALTGLLFAACAANAEEIKFDNRFLQDEGERNIRGWVFNAVEGYKPFGDVTAAMWKGRAGVRLASKGKDTTVYLKEPIPVKPGDRLTLTACVRGTGRGRLGVFQYGPNWKWMGVQGETYTPEAASGEPGKIVQRLLIPEGVVAVRPSLTACNGVDIAFFDLTIQREK